MTSHRSPGAHRRAAILLAVAAGACGPAPVPSPAAEPRPVRLAAIVDTVVARPVVAVGTLGARDEVPLGFKVGGVVARVLVDDGARVRRGQLLATLETTEVDAGVARAQSAAAKAERDLERVRRLYADSVATLAQLQDATTGLEVARADLSAARFNRGYAVITAPADGVVLRRLANAGELVSPGAPVVVLASAARGTVLRAGLPDRDVVRVRMGQPATVAFDAYPGREFAGRVLEVAAAATPRTGTYTVELALPGAADLPTGLVGRVTIQVDGSTRAWLVPVEALVDADERRATVFVLAEGGRVSRREVTVGFLDGLRAAVTAGLEGATQVVTDGAPYLDDGDAVRVTR